MLLFSLLACTCAEPPTAPAAPAPWTPGKEVPCELEGGTLAASWMAPTAQEGPFPTAVIAVGARPWNRWGDTPDAPWGHYRQMAVALVESGAAVLLFDKGGTGATGGLARDMAGRTEEVQAAAACALEQPGADPKRLVLVGHSQGSSAAVRATINGTPTEHLVLLSPVATEDELAALPPGVRLTLIRGELDGPDADDGRLRVLSARGLRARHVVIPHADHLLLDASSRVPEAGHPDTAVHAMALRALTDAVVTTERSGP